MPSSGRLRCRQWACPGSNVRERSFVKNARNAGSRCAWSTTIWCANRWFLQWRVCLSVLTAGSSSRQPHSDTSEDRCRDRKTTGKPGRSRASHSFPHQNPSKSHPAIRRVSAVIYAVIGVELTSQLWCSHRHRQCHRHWGERYSCWIAGIGPWRGNVVVSGIPVLWRHGQLRRNHLGLLHCRGCATGEQSSYGEKIRSGS